MPVLLRPLASWTLATVIEEPTDNELMNPKLAMFWPKFTSPKRRAKVTTYTVWLTVRLSV